MTPNRIASANAGQTPKASVARKTIAEAETVAPSASDIMLPVSVMKVMPTATQPMKDMALSSAKKLGSEMIPGVLSIQMASAANAPRRMPQTIR